MDEGDGPLSAACSNHAPTCACFVFRLSLTLNATVTIFESGITDTKALPFRWN